MPFLILGNKIDLGRAASEEDLRYQLGLFETYGKETKERDPNVRPIELYMCSVVRKMGYGDGMFSSWSPPPSCSRFLVIHNLAPLLSGFKWLAQFL